MCRIGDRLRIVMNYRDCSINRLSNLTGIGRQSIQRVLKGEGGTTVENLYKICKELNTNPNYLMGFGEDIENYERFGY